LLCLSFSFASPFHLDFVLGELQVRRAFTAYRLHELV